MTSYFTTELIQNPSGDTNYKIITQQHDPTSTTYNSRGSVIGSIGLVGYGSNTTNNTSSSDKRESFINFHRGENDQEGFITITTGNDQERIMIDDTGNVGINTTTPNYKLDVSGKLNLTGTIYVDNQ